MKDIFKHLGCFKQEITRADNNVSSWEKQIISLVRAIIHDYVILIMNEAISHIKTETKEVKIALNICAKIVGL